MNEVEGMSDLSIRELEDIIWDDFDRSDDHIVPHSSNDGGSGDSCEEGNCNKLQCEVTPVRSNVVDLHASDRVCQGKEERETKALSKNMNMLGKDPWSRTADNVFAALSDAETVKDMPGLSSDDTGTASHGVKSSNVISGNEFCADDCILNDIPAAADSNSYNHPLGHIHQTDDLTLFSNDCEDKESSDPLYYGWPDIGSLEDVDTMLRSCDSSFGLGITGNDDELAWFASEDPIGGSEEALRMDFKFPCSEPCALTNISRDHEPPESSNKRSIYISESKDEFKLNDQKKQSKHQNQREGMKAGQCLGNNDSFYHVHDLRSNDNQLSSIDESDGVFTSLSNQQQMKNIKLNSFGYMQSNAHLHPDYDHAPNQTTGGPMLTDFKSKNTDPIFPSPKESSCTSNQVHSMETKVHPSLTGNQRHMGMELRGSKRDLVSAPKQVYMSGNKLESQNDIEGDQKGASAEMGSLNVPESSSISSELDEISQEATSFHQLKQVMEQLDFRTKLCIRDSLYRLARSAEQRHSYASLSGSSADCTDASGPLTTERTHKCTGFMDMETDTNPIDRSIAHLLFHRPSDSSNLPASVSPKPNATILGEEAVNESDDKIVWTEDLSRH